MTECGGGGGMEEDGFPSFMVSARSLNVVVVVVGCIYRERVCVWWGVHNTHIYHKKGTFVGLVVVALL